MSNFEASYEKILEFIKSHSEKDNFSIQIRKQKLTDIEVIAMNFTANTLELIVNVNYLECYLRY